MGIHGQYRTGPRNTLTVLGELPWVCSSELVGLRLQGLSIRVDARLHNRGYETLHFASA